jgi:hypothetical protein
MESEKIKQPIIIKSSRISYDYLIGKSNPDAIAVSNTPVEAIRLKNNLNQNVSGNPLLSGDIQFSQIGNSSTADVIRDELPIDFLIMGQKELVVLVTPIVGMDIKDLNVLLFCKKE